MTLVSTGARCLLTQHYSILTLIYGFYLNRFKLDLGSCLSQVYIAFGIFKTLLVDPSPPEPMTWFSRYEL